MKKQCIINPVLPLGHTFSLLTKAYYGAFTKRVEHHELDKYYTILMLLENDQVKYSQQILADCLKLDKVSMVRILDYLHGMGYIQRITNPDDRREKYVALTDHAKAQMPEIRQIIHQMNADALAGLTDEEKEVFFKALISINQHLHQLPSNPVIIKFKKRKISHGKKV